MGVVAVIGAKGAPGATTAAVALALCWPRPALLADADPAGGDIAAGWLAGRVGLDRGLLSFAAATRHTPRATAAELAAHVAAVPDTPGVLLLPGLAHAGQASALDERVWTRLVQAAGGPWPPADPADRMVRVDLVADCGRIGPGTPWPLASAAAAVLLVTRPTLRGVHHARHALTAVQAGLGDTSPVGLVVCGPGPYPPGEVGQAVGLPVRAVLPGDPRAASALSDGIPGTQGWARTALGRAAGAAARSLSAATAAEPADSWPSTAGSDATGWQLNWGVPGQAPGQPAARNGR
jgi:hypothetical protein